MKIRMRMSLLAMCLITAGLTGCSNHNGSYNVKNSWCPEIITEKTDKITLSMDVLFSYNSSTLNNQNGNGIQQLAEIVSYLDKNNSEIKSIKIIGYTDRIGSNSFNDKLGLERAAAIENYLKSHKIDTIYEVESKGKREPITDGCHNLQGSGLISCLQPDRRVELLIEKN